MPSSNAPASLRGFSVMWDPVRREIPPRSIEADVERAAEASVRHRLLDDHGFDPLDAAGQTACADLGRISLGAEFPQLRLRKAHVNRPLRVEGVDARDLAKHDFFDRIHVELAKQDDVLAPLETIEEFRTERFFQVADSEFIGLSLGQVAGAGSDP